MEHPWKSTMFINLYVDHVREEIRMFHTFLKVGHTWLKHYPRANNQNIPEKSRVRFYSHLTWLVSASNMFVYELLCRRMHINDGKRPMDLPGAKRPNPISFGPNGLVTMVFFEFKTATWGAFFSAQSVCFARIEMHQLFIQKLFQKP